MQKYSEYEKASIKENERLPSAAVCQKNGEMISKFAAAPAVASSNHLGKVQQSAAVAAAAVPLPVKPVVPRSLPKPTEVTTAKCVLCERDCKKEDQFALRCGHIVHKKCLGFSAQGGYMYDKCRTCGKQITEIEHDQSFS